MTVSERLYNLITALSFTYATKPIEVQKLRLSWEDRDKSGTYSDKVLFSLSRANMGSDYDVFGTKHKYQTYYVTLRCETDESISIYENEEIIKNALNKIEKIEDTGIEDINIVGDVDFVYASDETNKTSSVGVISFDINN